MVLNTLKLRNCSPNCHQNLKRGRLDPLRSTEGIANCLGSGPGTKVVDPSSLLDWPPQELHVFRGIIAEGAATPSCPNGGSSGVWAWGPHLASKQRLSPTLFGALGKSMNWIKLHGSMSETSTALQILSRLTFAAMESGLERAVQASELPVWSSRHQGSIDVDGFETGEQCSFLR